MKLEEFLSLRKELKHAVEEYMEFTNILFK